jgi:hypothetical protein
MRIKQQHDSSGIAGFVLEQDEEEENGTKMQAPKLRFNPYILRSIRPWE